jgi:hypothetical protein
MPQKARHVSVAACVALLAAPSLLSAQVSPLQVEVNGGVAVPTQEFADPGGLAGEAESGASFGVHFALTQGHVSWYLGFSEHRAKCGGGACSGDFVSTAWDLGLRLNLLTGPVVPWLRLGTTSQITRAQLADPTADPLPGQPIPMLAAESGRSWGVEAGAGIMIRLTERFGINPGVRYARVNPSFRTPLTGSLEMRTWVMDLGLILGF